jgi:hypothetical protein
MQNEGGIPPGYKNSIQNLKIQTYFVRKLVKKKKIYNYRHSSKRGNKNFKGKNHFFFSWRRTKVKTYRKKETKTEIIPSLQTKDKEEEIETIQTIETLHVVVVNLISAIQHCTHISNRSTMGNHLKEQHFLQITARDLEAGPQR